jgi:hypothetical protein
MRGDLKVICIKSHRRKSIEEMRDFEEVASHPFCALHPSQTKCPLFKSAGILEQSMKARRARNREAIG